MLPVRPSTSSGGAEEDERTRTEAERRSDFSLLNRLSYFTALHAPVLKCIYMA